MKIFWTKTAKKNLNDIQNYISPENSYAAVEVIENIIQTIELLKVQPEMGRSGRIFGTRELILSSIPYIIPYRVKGKDIQILRVMHSSIKWPKKV